MNNHKSLITLICLFFVCVFIFCSCSKDDEKIQEKFQLEKTELTETVSFDRRLMIKKGNQEEPFVVMSEDEFVASAKIEDGGKNYKYVRITANHVGETKIHVSQNGSEEICIVKCVPRDEFIGWFTMDFNITRETLKELIKDVDYLNLSETSNAIVLNQYISHGSGYEVKTTFYLDNNDKLYRIKKEFPYDEHIVSSYITWGLEDYLTYESRKTGPRDQSADSSGMYYVTTTRYIYNYPSKGYAVYHEKDYSGKYPKKHYIYFSRDKESAVNGF